MFKGEVLLVGDVLADKWIGGRQADKQTDRQMD